MRSKWHFNSEQSNYVKLYSMFYFCNDVSPNYVPPTKMAHVTTYKDGTCYHLQRWYMLPPTKMVHITTYKDGTCYHLQRWYILPPTKMVHVTTYKDGTYYHLQRWYMLPPISLNKFIFSQHFS